MRLRFLLADWLTAFKYRHGFLTTQRRTSWKVAKKQPAVTAPKDARKQWRTVLRFKRPADDISERLLMLKGRAEQKRMRMLG